MFQGGITPLFSARLSRALSLLPLQNLGFCVTIEMRAPVLPGTGIVFKKRAHTTKKGVCSGEKCPRCCIRKMGGVPCTEKFIHLGFLHRYRHTCALFA